MSKTVLGINKAFLAELIGTFALTFLVGMSLNSAVPVVTPFVAALTLGVFVYTLGPVSGAQFNPAVTIALLAVKKMKVREAVSYIFMQFFGAVLAMVLVQYLSGVNYELIVNDNSFKTLIAEALGAFVLMFGISAVVYSKVEDNVSGLLIGGSLLVGVLAAAGVSNGVLNPAVALGVGSFSVVYLIAPILGAICAVKVFAAVAD